MSRTHTPPPLASPRITGMWTMPSTNSPMKVTSDLVFPHPTLSSSEQGKNAEAEFWYKIQKLGDSQLRGEELGVFNVSTSNTPITTCFIMGYGSWNLVQAEWNLDRPKKVNTGDQASRTYTASITESPAQVDLQSTRDEVIICRPKEPDQSALAPSGYHSERHTDFYWWTTETAALAPTSGKRASVVGQACL